MLIPGCFGGIDVEASAQTKVPGSLRVIRDTLTPGTGIRGDDRNPMGGGILLGAGLGDNSRCSCESLRSFPVPRFGFRYEFPSLAFGFFSPELAGLRISFFVIVDDGISAIPYPPLPACSHTSLFHP